MAVEMTDELTPEGLRGCLQGLVDYAAARGLVPWGDRVWSYNATLEALGATGPGPDESWVLAEEPADDAEREALAKLDLEATLAALADVAAANGRVEDTAGGRDRVSMQVMGTLMPRPSETAARFFSLLSEGRAKDATDWFYGVCCDAGYVRRAATAVQLHTTMQPTRARRNSQHICTARRGGARRGRGGGGAERRSRAPSGLRPACANVCS